MRVEAVVVAEIVAAGRIPERVGQLGLGGGADGRIFDSEAQDGSARGAFERADQRIIDVEHDSRLRIQLRERAAPAAGDRVDLTVAVELVAHQVGEQHRRRAHRRGHVVEGRLVGLEHADQPGGQPPAGAAGVDQRRQHAAHQVGAGAVVQHAPSSAREDAREHRRGGGLAVGAGDEHRGVQLGGQAADEIAVEALGDQTGQRSAAAAQQARRAPRQLAGPHAGQPPGRGGREPAACRLGAHNAR